MTALLETCAHFLYNLFHRVSSALLST